MGRLRDPLTGLYLRDRLHEIGERFISRGTPFSIVLIDIDRFKLVNDVFGHQVGDNVLQQLTQFIQKFLRRDDIFIRYGGDEFIILLPNTTKSAAQQVIKRIKNLLEMEQFGGEPPIFVSFSSGISAFPEDSNNLDELIEIADKRLYTNKKRGALKSTTHHVPEEKFVGRAEELKTLRKLLIDVKNGAFRSALIYGPPGIGKSRLVEETLKFADLIGLKYSVEKFFPVHKSLLNINKNWENLIKGPDIIVLEDIHNLPQEVFPRIFDILNTAPSHRMLVLTARCSNLNKDIYETFLALEKDGLIDIIQLHPLRRRFISEFLYYFLKGSASEEIVEFLEEKSGGNPYYLQLITRSAVNSGLISYIEGIWYLNPEKGFTIPPPIERTVSSFFEKISDEQKEILIYSSLLPGEIDISIFNRVLGMPKSRVTKIFDQLIKSGWFRETAPGKFTFTYGIVKDIISKNLSKTRRQMMYKRLARILKNSNVPDEILAEIYYHAGYRDKTLRLALKIGEDFFKKGYFNKAVKFLTIAEELATKSNRGKSRLGKIHRLLAEVYLNLGDIEKSEKYIELVVDELPQTQNLFLKYRFEIQFGSLENAYEALKKLISRTKKKYDRLRYKIHLLGLLLDMGRIDDARNLYDELRKTIKSGLNRSLEISLCSTALDYAIRVKFDDIEDCLVRMKKYVRDETTEPLDRILIYTSLGVYHITDTETALDYLKKALEIAEKIGDLTRTAAILVNIGLIWSRHGYQKEATNWFDRALKLKEKIGDVRGTVIVNIDLGYAYTLIGEFERSEWVLKNGIARNELFVNSTLLSFHLWHALTFNYIRWGKLEEAIISCNKLEEFSSELGEYLPGEVDKLRGVIFVKKGQIDKAREIFDKLQPSEEKDFGYYAFASEMFLKTGEYREAFEISRKAYTVAEKVRYLWEQGVFLRYAGIALSHIGDKKSAREHFNKAIFIFRAISNRYEENETRRIMRELL